MTRVERWGGTAVLVVDADGPVVGGREARDLVAEAFGESASMLAIPAAWLDPAFFDLRSGVVGELPEPAASSVASALVRGSNAGTQHWFVPSLDALGELLERG